MTHTAENDAPVRVEALTDPDVMMRAMYGAATDPDGVLHLSAVAAANAVRECVEPLLLDYTRWLFDKQNIMGGRFDYLPGKFMADREARPIPPGSRCTCGAGDHRPPGAHNIHCADPDASATRVIPPAVTEETP